MQSDTDVYVEINETWDLIRETIDSISIASSESKNNSILHFYIRNIKLQNVVNDRYHVAAVPWWDDVPVMVYLLDWKLGPCLILG